MNLVFRAAWIAVRCVNWILSVTAAGLPAHHHLRGPGFCLLTLVLMSSELFTHLNGSIQVKKDNLTDRTEEDRSAPTQKKRSLGPGSQTPSQAPSLTSCVSLGMNNRSTSCKSCEIL